MGLLNMFSGNTKQNEKSNFPWIVLNNSNQLKEFQQNATAKILIFKHSTRCGISAAVLSRFEKKHQDKSDRYHFYYLDLLNQRPLSAEIAEHFNVIHQSPQLIIIEKGMVKAHASHYDILDIDI